VVPHIVLIPAMALLRLCLWHRSWWSPWLGWWQCDCLPERYYTNLVRRELGIIQKRNGSTLPPPAGLNQNCSSRQCRCAHGTSLIQNNHRINIGWTMGVNCIVTGGQSISTLFALDTVMKHLDARKFAEGEVDMFCICQFSGNRLKRGQRRVCLK